MIPGISENRMGSVPIVENPRRTAMPRPDASGRQERAKPAVQGRATRVVKEEPAREMIGSSLDFLVVMIYIIYNITTTLSERIAHGDCR